VKIIEQSYDVVVCGGGLAGFCAAVAAARNGAATCLVQDRPVFGGNSSSEIRVTPHGAAQFHGYARETGILSELLIEERARNHEPIFENGWTNSVWDLTMYDMAVGTPNLSFHLNTVIQEVELHADGSIAAVTGRMLQAETALRLSGKLFIDCTGDGVVAALAGCEWRMGTESRAEFNEPHAPERASGDTMGNSIHFKAKDMGRPVPFEAPEWAVRYEDASFFYEQGRNPWDIRGGYWWLEIGVPWHTIHDAEDIRHELTRHTLGVWDWIKNRDPVLKEKAANYALDWIGQVPGKRESRRIMGQYLMTEHDPMNRTVFDDEVAFGGWFLDLHTPGGLLAATSEPASAEGYSEVSEYARKSYCGPYGIPLRIMIAKDVGNLMMAGRNVSTTHAALGTVRVMGTTAVMGQAAGTAAAVSLQLGMPIGDVPSKAIHRVQQRLLRDGCFLPNVSNADPLDLARSAAVTASSEALLYGAGPESRPYAAVPGWEEQTGDLEADRLTHRRGQWIAAGKEGIRTISVCITNDTDRVQPLELRLVPVEDIWDYRCEPGPALAGRTIDVPPGERRWVSWEANVGAEDGLVPNRYVRLDLLANPGLVWHRAGRLEPGHLSAFDMGDGRMRRFGQGATMSFRVEPPQSCYPAAHVASGVTRPQASTNLWRSNPQEPLPQWLQLSWPRKVDVREVELTFPGHLVREYHVYPPLYRDPQCAKAYSIEVWTGSGWEEVVRVKDNVQRQRKHRLVKPAATDRLRVVIHATHGDPAAALFEVRCYE